MNDRMNRRDAAKRFFLASAALAAPGWVLTACGGGELTCTDTKGLSPEDVQMRSTLAYSDKATDAAKTCEKCQLYKPGAEKQCGGCNVLKGPIHPQGTCKSFAPKA